MAIEPTLEPTLEDLRNPGSNTTKLDRSEESSTTSLYGAAIGSIGKHFYLPIFNRFEAADRGGISWNWAASLTTLNWMAFRSLWSAALAYAGAAVGLALLIFGIGRLVFRFSEPVEMALLVAYLALMFIVPGLFANALLHADCRKRMARALAANTTLPEACTMLASQAPSRTRLAVLAVINLLALGAAIGAYLNFPTAGSLPRDTLRNLATIDPLGTRAAAPAAAAASAASAPIAAPASAPASAPTPAVSTPASSPTSAPASAPASAASAPASAASAAKPATKPVAAASAPKAALSAPKSATPASSAVPAAAPTAKAASAPASTTPAPPANTPSKAASAAGRVAVGVVQVDPPRKAPVSTTAAASARAASAAEPAASSPQEVGKVYSSEPAPVTAPAVAGKAATPPATAKPKTASSGAKTDGKYLVNVGLFAQEANAANAMAKLKDANLPAYTEEIRSPTKGKLTRVRVGPFATQAEADAAIVKIRALGLDALQLRP